MRPSPWLVLLLCAACPRPTATSAQLFSQVKVGLSDRDAKIQSYRFSGLTREQGQEAKFQFEYRAPSKMKGELKAPQTRTYSFDGDKLYEIIDSDKRFITYDLKLTPERSALLLTQTFSPFAPEGFRVPLLTRDGVVVQRVTHPKATEAVEVKMSIKDEAGQPLSVTYLLRWPGLDFLSKKTETAEGTMEVRVDEEQCEDALKMCFPRQLTHWEGKNPVATTVMSKIEINPAIPNGQFSLAAPDGFETVTKSLGDEAK